MKTDPAEANHDDAAEVARLIKLGRGLRGARRDPVEVQRRQLDQLSTDEDDLRLMLKEAALRFLSLARRWPTSTPTGRRSRTA